MAKGSKLGLPKGKLNTMSIRHDVKTPGMIFPGTKTPIAPRAQPLRTAPLDLAGTRAKFATVQPSSALKLKSWATPGQQKTIKAKAAKFVKF